MMNDLRKHKINAFDVSADEQLVCTGTNNSLNVLQLEEGRFQTKTSFQLSHNLTDSSGRVINVKPIVDLKFNANLAQAEWVATSSSSGVIAVWDLNESRNQAHINLLCAFTEHKQTVNSISWDPTNACVLLSGSQDRRVKTWDVRVKASTITFHPRSGFVRDVQYRRSDGDRFAAAFDNGTVQVWDLRFPKSCEVRFTAHDMALSVDWHPEASNLLASGGRDGYIKVWNYDNLENTDRANSSSTSVFHRYHSPGENDGSSPVVRSLTPTENSIPTYTVQTVGSSVTRVRWRPNHYYQIASSSSRGGSISLWNIAEPNVPLALLGKYPDPVVCFAWKDQLLRKEEVSNSSLYDWWRTDEKEVETPDPKYEEFNTSTVNSSFSGLAANSTEDFGEAAGDVERYDLYHKRTHKYQDHVYKSTEESETSWGVMISSSKISGVQALTLDKAVKPLTYIHPSCISISPKGHLAMVHDHIDKDHADKVLRIVSKAPSAAFTSDATSSTEDKGSTSEVTDGEQEGSADEKQTVEQQKHRVKPQKHMIRIFKNPDKASVLFDSQRFSTLAQNYHTPQTMRMERDKRYADMQQNFASTHQMDRSKHSGLRDAHAVSASCDHNAKVAEEASAPDLAQLWRVVKLYLKLEDQKRNASDGIGTNMFKQSLPGVGLSSFHGSAGELKHLWGESEERSEANDLTASKKSASIQTKSSTSSGEGDLDGEDDETALLFSQSPVESKSSLWQRGVVNLLMKLNKIQPLKGEEFLLSSDTMIQDNIELKDAFMLANRAQWHKKEDLNDPSFRRRQLHTHENPLRKESRYLRDLALRHHREAQLHNPAKLTRKSRLKRSSSEGLLGAAGGSAEEAATQNDSWGHKTAADNATRGNTSSGKDDVQSYLKMVNPRLIHEILDHHAERGDVQTCVMISLVLEKHIEVDATRLRQWLCSYIDVLQRLQLFSVAARIISTCNNEYVQARYQRSNVVAMQCTTPGCNEKIVKTGFKGQCQTCAKTISECSICQLPVRDVFVWCQVCAHGGHLAHLEHWFKTEKLCPTGCGHACNLFSRSAG